MIVCVHRAFEIANSRTLKCMPTIDREHQLSILSSLGEPARALIGKFLSSIAGRVMRIQTAIDSADLGELGDAAHSLKGASGIYGAAALAQLASELEIAARNRDTERAFELVKNLGPLAQCSVDESRALLETVNSGG